MVIKMFLTIRPFRNSFTTAFFALILIAFGLQAAIPAGFMPSFSKDGYGSIEICSGAGTKIVKIPVDAAPDSDQHDKGTGSICAYQALSAAKILLPPVLLVANKALGSVQPALGHTPSLTTSWVYSDYESRGPPIV